jgi:hypothetical protein
MLEAMNYILRAIFIGSIFGIIIGSTFIFLVSPKTSPIPYQSTTPELPEPPRSSMQGGEFSTSTPEPVPTPPKTVDPKELPTNATVLATINKNQVLLYTKNNDVWRLDLSSTTSTPERLVHQSYKIDQALLSPDKKTLIYTLRKKPFGYSTMKGLESECISETTPDTIFTRNLETNQEKIAFRTTVKNATITSLQFFDAHTLFFMSGGGKTYDLSTGRLEELPEFFGEICRSHFFQDWSNDKRFALIHEGYYEGHGWSVYDSLEHTISDSISPPELEGGLGILGFIDPNHLVAYRTSWNTESPEPSPVPRLELYDTRLKRTKFWAIPHVAVNSYPISYTLSPTSTIQSISVQEGGGDNTPQTYTTILLDTIRNTITTTNTPSSTIFTSWVFPQQLDPDQTVIVRDRDYQSSTLWRVKGTFENRSLIDNGDIKDAVAY